MNAPIKPPTALVPFPQRQERAWPEIADALRAYDDAQTDSARSRALALIARLRAEHRRAHGKPDLAAEAHRIIEALAAKWTAWPRTGP